MSNHITDVTINPEQRFNQRSALLAWNAFLAEMQRADGEIANNLAAYERANDGRVAALEEQVRLDPKRVEDAIKAVLNDPALAQALAGSMSKVPGTDWTIGSVVKAYMVAPKPTSIQEVYDANDNLISVRVGVLAGDVSSNAVFTVVRTDLDSDGDGITDQREHVCYTNNFGGMPATFRTLSDIRRTRLLPNYVHEELMRSLTTSIVIDLVAQFVTASSATINAVDIDGDGAIGLPAPTPVDPTPTPVDPTPTPVDPTPTPVDPTPTPVDPTPVDPGVTG